MRGVFADFRVVNTALVTDSHVSTMDPSITGRCLCN
ncbi:unnamed protein product [Gongylonema pulchrum]|uniref:Aconitase domain-containing protein n=1 Tax=Gongylonema pulchrum TaxID=637853 RepID=A0A183DI37_9BILA|nr:unnamed protein product [Gongylonema pulchrum]